MSQWYAHSGEDRIVARIFRKIGTTNKVAVEFGAADGVRKSNTAHFREHGWTVRMFDVEPLDPIVTQADITAENVNRVFDEAGIPYEFDLLSIDIDGNDLWVWEALAFRPRVVIIEYNPKWKAHKSRTVRYDPHRRWDRTDYYGASALALTRLGRKKGYDLVASTKPNLIFVLKGLQPAIKVSDVLCPLKMKQKDPEQRKWMVYR